MLLRRVIEHVKAQNWLAVGIDFVIVVAGVFIGIQMSNWNESRSKAAVETAMLHELRAALVADAEAIDGVLEHYRRVDERVGSLLAHMQEGKPYTGALDSDFGVLYGFGNVELNRAAYESLKSHGLDLISDDDLRSHIVRIYEQSHRKVEAAADSELRVILNLLQPYFLTHFKDLRFHRSATPLDYQALLKDAEFLNIVDYRLQIVRQNSIPSAEAALAETKQLIDRLNRKLDERAPSD